ncbi:uncharacterized protein (DUF1800 family) [Chitinophaga skermanii]|uniref:Uncharacterized protein (DUF1800 family) n=1 Tax=Chitinophaga skermanii TaxID=331697 RepID=A0A327R561_9BACT|nr:DUF1800 domain-containing protein [Chitinophaga skermanii]RAJ10793.1 uncharacterized protein (DUF1800 family) [Chitinophaga skermanii]
MDRRAFLSFAPLSPKKAKKLSYGRTFSGVNLYNGEWTTAQVVHLLKRAMFGATPADVAYFKTLTMDQAVETLLNISPMPTPPVNNYNVDGYSDPTGVAAGATWVTAPEGDEEVQTRRKNSYKYWWIGLMLNQQRTIHEKMVLFWHNHFATETNTVKDGRYLYNHNITLRQYALGNFKALTKAVTLDPAMLVYLNGYLNVKTAPDENYARELHELFTVGKGPDSHFTEPDVQATARVLTGYKIDKVTCKSYFDATLHDSTNKEFSTWYGSKVISGKTGNLGTTELDDLLNIIFSQAEVAKFICRKLYRFFVYYDIDQSVEDEVITPLANLFRQNNYEIKPVLQALFKSEHFYDPLNMSCLIKSPLDFTVGLCREFGVTFPPASNYNDAYGTWQVVQYAASIQQQNIGDPPGVSGWEAYYQEPQFHELWINTDTLPKRNQFSDLAISIGYTIGGHTVTIDPIDFAKHLPDPSDPIKLVSDSLDILYRMGVSTETKTFLKDMILLTGTETDYYWTNAWNAYESNPDMANKDVVLKRLQALYKYIMNLSEYQLA